MKVFPYGRTVLGDSVDRILAEWREERPDLPVDPVGVVNRVARLRARFDDELSGLFARYDLTLADFTVLAALRRSGPPFTLPQGDLMTRLGLTSGTVSVRLGRLAGKGVVARAPHPDDARGVLVSLTEQGARLFDEVAPAHLHNEQVLLSALTGDEQAQLADLLRRLLVGFEHDRGATVHGLTLLPAHVARRMRVAVGLSDTPGLLVREVGPDAAAAGLRPGDLLTGLDTPDGVRPLLSCLDLAGPPPYDLQVLRGADTVVVGLPA